MNDFDAAVRAACTKLATSRIRDLADSIAQGRPDEAILADLADESPAALRVLASARAAGLTGELTATYLRGAADGYDCGIGQQTVQVVWSGPSVHDVPTRSTAQVLTELIARAERELILVTYSARPYQPILDALAAALIRGVSVTAVVETLQGAGSALAGTEPAAAFGSLPAITLWHWPKALRPHPGAKMHAKMAVADRRELFTSSVNLTESGVANSIEAGLLVRGGTAPQRAAEHVLALCARGVLQPL